MSSMEEEESKKITKETRRGISAYVEVFAMFDRLTNYSLLITRYIKFNYCNMVYEINTIVWASDNFQLKALAAYTADIYQVADLDQDDETTPLMSMITP